MNHQVNVKENLGASARTVCCQNDGDVTAEKAGLLTMLYHADTINFSS